MKKRLTIKTTIITTLSPKDICGQALDIIFNYKIQNSDIDKVVFNLNYKEYLNVKTLRDYFFAHGESDTAGGYSWERTEFSNGVCQIKVILYDEETDEKVNPIWDIKETKITCGNSGAFDLTPELGFSD